LVNYESAEVVGKKDLALTGVGRFIVFYLVEELSGHPASITSLVVRTTAELDILQGVFTNEGVPKFINQSFCINEVPIRSEHRQMELTSPKAFIFIKPNPVHLFLSD